MDRNEIQGRVRVLHASRNVYMRLEKTVRGTPLQPKRYDPKRGRKIGDRRSSTDGGSPLTESPSLHGVHPNCSESLSSSQSSPPPLFLRSPESPSLSPLTAGSHPLVQDQFLFGQSGGATTRDDPTTRVPPHWIEDPAAAPRYRKPADHWTSRRYSLLSSFRPLPPLFSLHVYFEQEYRPEQIFEGLQRVSM